MSVKKFGYVILMILILSTPLSIPFFPRVSAEFEWSITLGTSDSVETSLDPANAYDYFGWEMIQNLGSCLVDYRSGAAGSVDDIIPALATSWNVSADGLQWTFTLRQGVKYDDGTMFNATDVKYTFDREIGINDPNGPFMGIGFSDIIQDITVVDTYTVRFDLKMPFSPFLSLMASPECVMVDPKYAPMHGTSWSTTDIINYVQGNARASYPIGLGPYVLENWTRVAGRDSLIILAADTNYWDANAGYPKNTKVTIRFYADSAQLALAVQTGLVDMVYRQLSTADIISMKNNPSLKVWEGPSAFIQYLCLQEKYWPFNETNIRRAVAAAINRTALVSTVFLGQAQTLYSLIPNGMAGHTDAFQNLGDLNYTRTRELLAPFGYNATNKLTFDLWYEMSGHYPQSPQQAQVLKSSIEASGVIAVNLQGLDWAGFGLARRIETMQAFIMGWYPDYIDADDYIFPLLSSTGASWIHLNYADAQMDQLIKWAEGNVSSSVRDGLYQQIQDLSVSDCPIVPLYQNRIYAVTSSNITGISLDITQGLRIWSISGAHVSIPGDINSDGIVDINDALSLAAAFESSPQNPNWNSKADLNNDNIVDIFDAIILAAHFNLHYP